jgi:signal peptidase II
MSRDEASAARVHSGEMAVEAEADSGRPLRHDGSTDVPGASTESTPSTPSAPARGSAWGSAEVRYSYLVSVAAAVFAIDQASKAVVMLTMPMGEVIPIIPPVLDLHYITNRGVAFGLFSRFGDIFIPVAVIIMLVILAFYRTLRGPRLWLRTALALQLGGALGNLLDRLRFGAVVDFLDFHIPAINFYFPVFNLADSAIVCGGILAVLLAARGLQLDGTRVPEPDKGGSGVGERDDGEEPADDEKA